MKSSVREMNCLCWEQRFVVDRFLYKGHDVVDVLGRRDTALLPLVVHPHVLPNNR